MPPIENYLQSTGFLFRYYKSLGDKALAQLNDSQIHVLTELESNSIATIVKHLSGNMLSRWTDFLTTDGEKPWRNREQEFYDDLLNKEQLLQTWEQGWACLFNAIDPLTEADLGKIVFIRNEGQTVLEAINRQLAHYSYHVGQIVFSAKALKGKDWQSLSIPKGQSATFNKTKFEGEKERKELSDIFPGLKPL